MQGSSESECTCCSNPKPARSCSLCTGDRHFSSDLNFGRFDILLSFRQTDTHYGSLQSSLVEKVCCEGYRAKNVSEMSCVLGVTGTDLPWESFEQSVLLRPYVSCVQGAFGGGPFERKVCF